MPTVSHIIGGVIDYCRHPAESILPRGLIAERFLDRWAYYVNQVSLTGESWYLEKATINVNEGQAEYAINASSFGKPVVVYILDDEQQIAGELEILRFRDQVGGAIYTNLPPGYSLPANEVPATKNGISFFTESGQLKARIVSTPGTSGTLVVHYVPSAITLSTLQDNISLLDNFSNLFKVHTALVCLPDCEWSGLSDDQNEKKRGRIKDSLLMEFELLTTQFNEYKSSLFQEQTSERMGFGEEYEYC